MKNFKRILALVLTLMFIVGSCASLSAFSGSTTTSWYAPAVSWIEDTGVDTIGATAGETIDRETFVKWVAKIESTYVNDDLWKDEVASTTFDDVTEENYRAAIAYSQQRGFIRGYDAKTFGPKDVLTFAQACAVIVRVRGYEVLVEDQSAANWEYNYINIANKIGAIDAKWVSEVGYYVPAHEMTKGEAAYLLWQAANEGRGAPVYGLPEDLKAFGRLDYTSASYLALVTVLNRAPVAANSGTQAFRSAWRSRSTNKGPNTVYMRYNMPSYDYISETQVAPTWIRNKYATLNNDADLWIDPTVIVAEPAMADYFAQYKLGDSYNWDKLLTAYRLPYSKDIVTTKTVVAQGEADAAEALKKMGKVEIKLFDGKGNFVDDYTFENTASETGAEQFQKLVRKGLGLSEKVGDTETFSLFDYVQEGSVIKITEKDDGSLAVALVDNHVVDTFRVLKQTTNLAIYNAGLANAYGASATNALVLRSSYDETKDVTSWNGNKLTIGGTEYTILAPGSSYSGAQNELAVYDFVKHNGTKIDAAAAKKLIINAVEGEVVTVYSDMDGDGYYDVASVTESAAFKFSPNLNAAPAGDYTVKGIPSTGTVVLNATVGTDYNCANTDPYTIDTSKKTGKMQLVLATSDARHIAGFFDSDMDFYASNEGLVFNMACVDPDTHVVDVAAFQTGYIKNATATATGGYYTLTITTADGDVTAKIPAIGYIPTTQKMDVTAFGASTTFTLAAKGWTPFITDFYSANFEYAYVNADGEYIYLDGETEFYSDSLEIVAYYEGKPIYTRVPEGAAVVEGTKYSVASLVPATGDFEEGKEYYEVVNSLEIATEYVTGTEYCVLTPSEYDSAIDDLITGHADLYTKDEATYAKHENLDAAAFAAGEFYTTTDCSGDPATTFVAGTTYYSKNPDSWTAYTGSVSVDTIGEYWVEDGASYAPASITDLTFTFPYVNTEYYDADHKLIETTTFVSGTTYYTQDEQTYAVHTNMIGIVSTSDYFTKNGTTYTAVAAGTEFDPAVTYYTANELTYTTCTGLTAFAADTAYYTLSGTDYIEVDPTLKAVDPSDTILKITEWDYTDLAEMTADEFAAADEVYYVATTYVPADTKEDGKEYAVVSLGTPTELTAFEDDTVYFEESGVVTYLVTAAEKADIIANGDANGKEYTEEDFIALTRKTAKLEGYVGEQPEGTVILVKPTTDTGVYKFADQAAIDAKVSAWMTNKYIDFVEQNGKVIVVLDTVKSDETVEGFVVNATKGTDNTYNVILAKTGTAQNYATTYYATDMTLEQLKATKNSGTTMVAGVGYATNQNQADDLDPNTYGRKFSYFGEKETAVISELKAAFEANNNAGAIWYSAYGANAGYLELDGITEANVTSFMGTSTWAEAAAKIISGDLIVNLKGSVGVATFKVRASASSIWDSIENATYRSIYSGNVTTALKADDIVDQTKLIYVSMTKDAGEYSVMRLITPGTASTNVEAIGQQVITNTGITGSKGWAYGLTMDSSRVFQFVGYYKYTRIGEEAGDAAWFTDGISVLLSSTKNTAKAVAKSSDNSTVYTEVYDEKIATDAEYFVKEINVVSGKPVFDVRFNTVGTRTKTITYTPVLDSVVGGRYVLVQDAAGNAISSDSDAGKAALAEESYVNINGKVFFELSRGEYKYAGKYTSTVSYSAVEPDGTTANLGDFRLNDSQRATMNLISSATAMKREDKGYIPGYYFVTIDGTTYTTAGSTKVVIMTPDNTAGKVVGQVTTIKDLAANGSILFATRYQIAATGKNLTALTVIGELVGEAPKDPTPASTKIVYLGFQAETVLEAEEVGTSYVVRTSVPAYALDGSEFGYIYFEYDTTSAGFAKAAQEGFNFLIGNSGCFFEVTPEGKILNTLGSLYGEKTSATFKEVVNGEQVSYSYTYPCLADTLGSAFKTATITNVENGRVLATVGSSKNVDITNWNVKFVYTDIDGEQLKIAGDSTSVTVSAYDVAIENAMFASLKKEALAKALADKYSTASAATKKQYADAYAAEAEALATAKTAAADKYFNGAFWGTGAAASSPVANYFNKVKNSFGKTASLSFKYVEEDGVTYVIVPTFVLG